MDGLDEARTRLAMLDILDGIDTSESSGSDMLS